MMKEIQFLSTSSLLALFSTNRWRSVVKESDGPIGTILIWYGRTLAIL